MDFYCIVMNRMPCYFFLLLFSNRKFVSCMSCLTSSCILLDFIVQFYLNVLLSFCSFYSCVVFSSSFLPCFPLLCLVSSVSCFLFCMHCFACFLPVYDLQYILVCLLFLKYCIRLFTAHASISGHQGHT